MISYYCIHAEKNSEQNQKVSQRIEKKKTMLYNKTIKRERTYEYENSYNYGFYK